jgi:hypothetical protein
MPRKKIISRIVSSSRGVRGANSRPSLGRGVSRKASVKKQQEVPKTTTVTTQTPTSSVPSKGYRTRSGGKQSGSPNLIDESATINKGRRTLPTAKPGLTMSGKRFKTIRHNLILEMRKGGKGYSSVESLGAKYGSVMDAKQIAALFKSVKAK